MTNINYTMWNPDVKPLPLPTPKGFRPKKVAKTFSPISKAGRRAPGEAPGTTGKGGTGKENGVGADYFKFVRSLKDDITKHYHSARSRPLRTRTSTEPSPVPLGSISIMANSSRVNLEGPVVVSNQICPNTRSCGDSGTRETPMNGQDMFSGGILPSNNIFSRLAVPEDVKLTSQMPGWLSDTPSNLIDRFTVNVPSPQSPTNVSGAPENPVAGVMPGWLSFTPDDQNARVTNVSSSQSPTDAFIAHDNPETFKYQDDIFTGGVIPSNSNTMTNINYAMWNPDVKPLPLPTPKGFRPKKVAKTFSPISKAGRRVPGEAPGTTGKGGTGKENGVGADYFKFVRSLKDDVTKHYHSPRSRPLRTSTESSPVPLGSVSIMANSSRVNLEGPVVVSNQICPNTRRCGDSGTRGTPMNGQDMFSGGILPSNNIFSRLAVPEDVKLTSQMPGWLSDTPSNLVDRFTVNVPSPQSPTNVSSAPENPVAGVMPGWLGFTPDDQNARVTNVSSSQSPTDAFIAHVNPETVKYQDDIFTGGVIPSNSIFGRNLTDMQEELLVEHSLTHFTPAHRVPGWLDVTGDDLSNVRVKVEDVDIPLAFSPSLAGRSRNSFSSSSAAPSRHGTPNKPSSPFSTGFNDDGDLSMLDRPSGSSSSSGSSGCFGDTTPVSGSTPSRYVTPNETFSSVRTQWNHNTLDSTFRDPPVNDPVREPFVDQNNAYRQSPVISPSHRESSPGHPHQHSVHEPVQRPNSAYRQSPVISPHRESSPNYPRQHSVHEPVQHPNTPIRAPIHQPYFNPHFRHHPPVQEQFPNHNARPPGQGYDPHHPYFEHRSLYQNVVPQPFFQPHFQPQPPVYVGHPLYHGYPPQVPESPYSPHQPYWNNYPAVQWPLQNFLYPPQPPMTGHFNGAFGGGYRP